MHINVYILFLIISTFLKISNVISKNITIDNQNNNSICNKHGIYISTNNECKCAQGYTTHPTDSKIQCNYELRSLQAAKYISFFSGFLGADRFYLGYSMKGLFKCFIPIGALFLILKIQNNNSIQKFVLSYYLIFSPVVLMILLWILDLFLIISGFMTDSNGFALI